MHSLQKKILWTLFFITLLQSCAKAPIKIGFIASLSGRRSELGTSVRAAVQVAVNKINRAGGIKGRLLELFIEDDENNPARISHIIENFLQENIQFVIGPLTSNMAPSMVKASKDRNILILTPTVTTAMLDHQDDNIIRLLPSNTYQAETLAHYAATLPYNRYAVIYDRTNKEYTYDIYSIFKKVIQNKKPVQFVFEYGFSTSDYLNFNSLAQKMLREQPQALLLISSAVDVGAFAQQLYKLNKSIQILASRWAKTNDLIAHGGKGLENAILLGNPIPGEISPLKKEFIVNYKNFTYTPPSPFAEVGYETMLVLAESMNKSSEITPLSVKETLIKIRRFTGLNGNFELDSYGDAIRANQLFKIKNKQFLLIK